MSDNDKKRRFFLGTTVLLASLTCSVGAAAANAAFADRAMQSQSQAGTTEFILAPASGVGLQTFQHESHSSHASHSSHSSHYSNAG